MMVETQSREKQRALNIIWNASGDYSLHSEFEVYDNSGKAELYFNFVIGAVHKYYDYPLIRNFLAELKTDPDHVFYESILWIGLENGVFQKGRIERPVLDELRQSYARKVLRREDAPSLYYLVDEIKRAHFERALGEEPVMRDQVANILNVLEFAEDLDTGQILSRMNELIAEHFPLRAKPGKNQLKITIPGVFSDRFGKKNFQHYDNLFQGNILLRLFNIGTGEKTDHIPNLTKINRRLRGNPRWQNVQEQRRDKKRQNILNYYGGSILSEGDTRRVEQILCVDHHQGCHLHFTRGEIGENAAKAKNVGEHKKNALIQRNRNKKFYQERVAQNNLSILRLTNVIKNAMLTHLEASMVRSDYGQIVAGKVWRNLYLHDKKVFQKSVVDELGKISIDILLDGSCSQIDRQEIISSQAFIIAESLNRCGIPVRILSYCTNSDYTIVTLFRDYAEKDQNDRVFNYHSSGCNRDGLAIRTALYMMEKTDCERKILIVLSDGKPMDPQGVNNCGLPPDQNFYADNLGVNDTAFEVRKGRHNGVSILCVFTGLDDDIPAAKKIFGNGLVCIKSPDKFANTVGLLIANEIRNL